MEEIERDIVVFQDEEGNEIELGVVDYFEYEGEQYAVMIDIGAETDDEEGDEEEEYTQELYIFRIEARDGEEEFIPADEDKMDALVEIVEKRLEGCDCGEACDDCDCDK